jgi:hypothetical protein
MSDTGMPLAFNTEGSRWRDVRRSWERLERQIVGLAAARGEDRHRRDDADGRATWSRASSNACRAALPSAWTEDALPVTSMARSIADFAAGRSGDVALWSR